MAKGTTLRELQSSHLHLAYWETPYYKNAIQNWVSNLAQSDSVALDVGCGDGRFTDSLIKCGVGRVVASDCNLHSLESLALHASKNGYSDKLLLIQSDAEKVPLHKNSLDIVLSIGVLYYLNERFESGLSSILSLLKEGGHFIASEPDLEGCSLKALIFEGIEDFVLTLKGKMFTETVNGVPFKFRTFDRDEIKHIYNEHGLDILSSHGLSIFPSLLAIGKSRSMFNEDDLAANEENLRLLLDHYDQNGSVYKHIIWFCRKYHNS
ncbi:MAG: class I SAM-dependent methyltransferase [Chloroflexota bacterium]|nr:class I SAM-dependent methyltransferase [Chloroflexota bacterium]